MAHKGFGHGSSYRIFVEHKDFESYSLSLKISRFKSSNLKNIVAYLLAQIWKSEPGSKIFDGWKTALSLRRSLVVNVDRFLDDRTMSALNSSRYACCPSEKKAAW